MRRYIRPIIGGLLFLIGVVFMFLPMIPLGYLVLGASAVVLAPLSPPFRHLLRWLEERDSSGRVETVEKKINHTVDQWEKQDRRRDVER
jgi:uncharacterized membrane protein YbaN (DUF454 family)